MELNYEPNSKLEKFGEKVFNLLVENFSQTFYVGGMVRDLLLGLKVTDIDIASAAKPDQVILALGKHGINHNDSYKKFGVIVATKGNFKIEIATFRRDLPSPSRYPEISFAKSPKIDSQRRDFTINALYLSPKDGSILDFHNGLKDLKDGKLKFIGDPVKRIKEDPLRIIRALRFAKDLNFKIEKKSFAALEKNFSLVKTLTESRLKNELAKIKSAGHKKIINHVLDVQNLLDRI